MSTSFNGSPAVDSTSGAALVTMTQGSGVYVFNGAPAVDAATGALLVTSTGTIAGAPAWPVSSSTSTSITLVAGETYQGVNATAAATVNLPSGATLPQGKIYIIKDESGAAATNNVTVAANGTDKIDGQSSAKISINYGSLMLIWTGTVWSIV